jgi:hypothetical protein
MFTWGGDMRLLAVVLTALTAVACVGVGKDTASAPDSGGVQSQSNATVYLFRRARLAGTDANVTTRDKKIDVQIPANSYVVQEVSSGPQVVSVITGGNQHNSAKFDFVAGKKHYIEIEMTFVSVQLRMLEEHDAAYVLRSLRAVKPSP